MIKHIINFIKNSSLGLMSLVFTALILFGGFYFYMLIHLPDVSKLKNITMQVPLRIYSSDGKLMNEFGEKKRMPVILDQIPEPLIHAVLDTEDQRFYEHRGVDFLGLVRVTIAFIKTGKKSQGASTITMQVARSFFLNRKKTFARKFNEILLAFKIDSAFDKKEILELYLNKIYFGNRAYGVAAAAQVYYGKDLNELDLAEMATIAGLPQAPSRNNPIANPKAARARRNHVLNRMLERNHITMAEYEAATKAPIATNYHRTEIELSAPYASEMVRREMVEQYGEDAYDSGLRVYTTIDSRLQKEAREALRDGIIAYDQRHDYRGPEDHFQSNDKSIWLAKLSKIPTIGKLQAAVVLKKNYEEITALLADGETIEIKYENFKWAKPELTKGDLIRAYKNKEMEWRLAELPEIEGAIIAMDPKNGAILAVSGGFSYRTSHFNRATQAERQTGSAFKPFIYSAALEQGMTFASVINDAPVVLMDPSTNSLWRPQNVSQKFHGPTRVRTALYRSRNLVSIRLLQNIGVPFAVEYLKSFGFTEPHEAPPSPSLALGTGTTTPLKMTAGYSVFANGGYQASPFIIRTIIKSSGLGNKIVLQAKPKTIPEAVALGSDLPLAMRVITPQNAYLMTDGLKDVIRYGTARRAKVLNRSDLAGKTGTTNDQIDTWFSGFNSDLVTTVWLGFDQPKTTNEYGSQAALPIWIQFMKGALADKPLHSMNRPDDIITIRIDPRTGLLAHPEQDDAIFEIFTADTVPTKVAPLVTKTTDDAMEQNDQIEESLF